MAAAKRLETPARVVVCLAGISAAAGCGMSRQAQLEATAKDWCMTIRASQIIPVYPLTQDVQPGDVYLVQTTVDRQQEVYKAKGFLPLDNHLVRLQPTGYDPFYEQSFFVNNSDKTVMPARWGYTNYGAVSWTPAPGAAFPTYSFSVRQGAGLNLAVPVSGVPVGMSLMGTRAADGSVSIKEARTIGVDTVSLHRDLNRWAELNADFLRHYGPKQGSATPRNFLRVITRVYSTGSVTVALSDARSVAGGVDAGVPRPVDLLTPQAPRDHAGVPQQTLEDYRSRLTSINAMLAETEQPSRLSGSNAGLGADEVDAKTKAKMEAIRAQIEKRVAELNVAEAEVKKKADAAAEQQMDVAEAQRQLAAAKEALDNATSASAAADAKAIVEAAERTLHRKQAAAAEPLKELAAATGTAEVARNALAAAASMAPGGSLRLTAASSRFISMQEEFDPPLIIGYLAFDVPILADGTIGAPVPTQAQIDAGARAAEFKPEDVVRGMFPDGLDNEAYDTLAESAVDDPQAREAVAALDALAKHVPGRYVAYRTEEPGILSEKDVEVQSATYKTFKAYRGVARSSSDALKRALQREAVKITVDQQPTEVSKGSGRWERLQKDRAAYQRFLDDVALQRAHEAACARAGREYLRLIVADASAK